MTYELAKKLKEAGFEPKIVMVCKKDHDCRCDKPDCLIFPLNPPTLSDLIEACGERFYDITKCGKEYLSGKAPRTEKGRIPGGWEASTIEDKDYVWMWGQTPEEAVANLWLELNEK